jgi:hypothetical protein
VVGDARARVVADLSERGARRVLSENVGVAAHLMSDEWKWFVLIRPSPRMTPFATRTGNTCAARSMPTRPKASTKRPPPVAGVFHHISPHHADLYFNENGFSMVATQSVPTGSVPEHASAGKKSTAMVSDRAWGRGSISRWASTTSNYARWHSDTARRRNVWLIKPANAKRTLVSELPQATSSWFSALFASYAVLVCAATDGLTSDEPAIKSSS